MSDQKCIYRYGDIWCLGASDAKRHQSNDPGYHAFQPPFEITDGAVEAALAGYFGAGGAKIAKHDDGMNLMRRAIEAALSLVVKYE